MHLKLSFPERADPMGSTFPKGFGTTIISSGSRLRTTWSWVSRRGGLQLRWHVTISSISLNLTGYSEGSGTLMGNWCSPRLPWNTIRDKWSIGLPIRMPCAWQGPKPNMAYRSADNYRYARCNKNLDFEILGLIK